MNKAVIGTVLGLALVAGSVGSPALASGAKADVKVRGGFSASLKNLLWEGGNTDKKHDKRDTRGDKRHEDKQVARPFFGGGQVTSITRGTITAEGRDGMTWTIQTDADTKFVARGEKSGSLDEIEVGAWIAARGKVERSSDKQAVIDAAAVHYWNGKTDQKHRKAVGTIESINEVDGTIVIDTPKSGEVEVAITSDTAISEDGDAGTFADLFVGAKVKVKGIWDSIADVMTAVKVKILG